MLMTVKYILTDAEGLPIGAELLHKGKSIQCKTDELKRKRAGISFTNALLDAEGHFRAKDESKPLKEKSVGGVSSSSFNPVRGKPTKVKLKFK